MTRQGLLQNENNFAKTIVKDDQGGEHTREVPDGGYACGVGFAIVWQRGPLGRGDDRKAPNGAFVEDVIAACIERMKFYQSSNFACMENELALDLLKQSLVALNARTKAREARQVEGTHEK